MLFVPRRKVEQEKTALDELAKCARIISSAVKEQVEVILKEGGIECHKL